MEMRKPKSPVRRLPQRNTRQSHVPKLQERDESHGLSVNGVATPRAQAVLRLDQ